MATIKKVNIRGIRSFSNTDNNTIEFNSPLTLIQGKNGSGKTAIIEAVGYCFTGKNPLMTSEEDTDKREKEIGFVIDPRVAGPNINVTGIEARVQITLNDEHLPIGGTSMKITRSRTHVVSKTNQQGVTIKQQNKDKLRVHYLDADGEHQAVADDAAKEKVESCFQITNSLWEYAIFCPQSRADWPILSSKQTRNIFVKIFEEDAQMHMTRRDNCKEEIADKKKDRDAAQDREKEESALSAQYTELSTEMEQCVQRISEKREALIKLEEEQDAAEDLRRSFQNDLNEFENAYGLLEKKEFEQQLRQQKLKEEIAKMNSKNFDELKEVPRVQLARRLHEIAEEAARLGEKRAQLEKEIFELKETERSQQSVLKLQHPENLFANLTRAGDAQVQLDAKLSALNQSQFTQDTEDSPEAELTLENFEEFFQNHINKRQIELSGLEMNSSNSNLDELKRQQTEINTRLNILSKTMTATNAELLLHKKQQLGLADGGVEILDSSWLEREQAKNSLSKEECLKELAQHHSNRSSIVESLAKDEIGTEIARLEAEIDYYTSQATLNETLASKEDLESKIKVLCQRHSWTEKLRFDTKMMNSVKNIQNACRIDVERAGKEVAKRTTEFTLAENNVSDLQSKKNALLRELDELSSRLDHNSYINIDEQIRIANAKHLASERELKLHKAELELYELTRQSSHDTNACPMCLRPFDTQCSVERFDELIQEKINCLPAQIASFEETLQHIGEHRTALQRLKVDADKHAELSQHAVHVQSEIVEASMSLQISKTELDDAKVQKEKADAIYNDSREDLQSWAHDLSELMEEIQELTNRVEFIAQRYPHFASQEVKSVKTLKSHLLSLKEKKRNNTASDQINKIDYDIALINDNLAKAKSRSSLLQKLEDLLKSNHNSQESIAKLNTDLADCNLRLEKEEERVRQSNDRIKNAKDAIKQFEGNLSTLKRLRDLARNKKEAEDAVTEYNAKNDDLRQTKSALEHKNVQSRELTKLLMELEGQKVKIEQWTQLQAWRAELDDLNRENIDVAAEIHLQRIIIAENKETLKKETERVASIREKKCMLEQDLENEERQHDNLRTRLNDPLLRDIRARHHQTIHLIEATEQEIVDLQEQLKRIEVDIVNAHTGKLLQVNESLRTLWERIYQNDDIKYIKIVTEKKATENAAQPGAPVGPIDIRNLDYHIRMVLADDVEMPIRTRASAGQRQLASVIIRLALSEIFGMKCAMIALDEPTTNLDRENATALAQALSRLMARTENGARFQLMIITHDPKFVNDLCADREGQIYYKITKDREGFSKIRRKTFHAHPDELEDDDGESVVEEEDAQPLNLTQQTNEEDEHSNAAIDIDDDDDGALAEDDPSAEVQNNRSGVEEEQDLLNYSC